MRNYAFGVDVGGTTIKIGFFTASGELLEKWEIPTRKEQNGGFILTDIAASLQEKLRSEGLAPSDLSGVGIDVPGAVLEDGIVNRCVNLGWGVRPVAEELSQLLDGVRVCAANDANAAALGEMSMRKEWQSVVMITLGTGVGGGVIVDGKIVPGAFGGAGEIGHIPVRLDETETCGCGKKGCLEQYASAEGIARLAKKRLAESDCGSSLRSLEHFTSKEIFDAARDGDAFALGLVEEICQMLGCAMAAVACVADPEAFIIGGGVAAAGPILIDTIQKYYRQYAFHTSRDTAIVAASLGNDAGIYGAVQLVLSE